METDGILYVIYNDWIRSPETNKIIYKIGITRDTIEDRYYGLGLKMPGKFETVFAYKFDDCLKAEQTIHSLFNKCRNNEEWFTITSEQLKILQTNCELMGGMLITNEIKNEVENQTEENDFLEDNANENIEVIQKMPDIPQSQSPINPDFPCKVFVFNINRHIVGNTVYDVTRGTWKIAEKWLDCSIYQYAVGLIRGYSLGGYKINEWTYIAERDRYKFSGEEKIELKGYSWRKQTERAGGRWQFGSNLVVEFDGRGKYRLLTPNKEEWLDCV